MKKSEAVSRGEADAYVIQYQRVLADMIRDRIVALSFGEHPIGQDAIAVREAIRQLSLLADSLDPVSPRNK